MEDTSDSIKTMILKQMKPLVITFGDEIDLSHILGENYDEDPLGDDSTTATENVPKKTKTPKEVICPICSKTFPDLRYLNRHSSKHTNQFSCPHCKKAFLRKETLIKHIPRCKIVNPRPRPAKRKKLISITDEINKYYCEECSKRFTRKENYEQHVMIHSRTQVICHICQKVLGSFKSYRRHLLIHEEKKVKLSCQYCPSKFSLKSNLQRHCKLLQHQKNKIVCEKCNRSIKTDKLLLEHQNNETTSCIACSQIFCLDRDFKNHLKVAHHLWFRCKECSTTTPFMTRIERNLRDHAKKIHYVTLGSTDCYKDGWYMLLNS